MHHESVKLVFAESGVHEYSQQPCVSVVQSPVKGKGAKKAGSADLQLAGVLHIMKLLGAPPSSPEADAGPMASPGGRRRSGAAKIEERPLQPEVVSHIVDALFDR